MTDNRLPEADRQHLRLAEALADMVRMPGWKMYVQFLDQHKIQELGTVMMRATGIDSLVAAEGAKGAAAAFDLAKVWPEQVIEQAKVIRAKADKQEN